MIPVGPYLKFLFDLSFETLSPCSVAQYQPSKSLNHIYTFLYNIIHTWAHCIIIFIKTRPHPITGVLVIDGRRTAAGEACHDIIDLLMNLILMLLLIIYTHTQVKMYTRLNITGTVQCRLKFTSRCSFYKIVISN